MLRSVQKLGFKFTLTMAGYNLIRLPKLRKEYFSSPLGRIFVQSRGIRRRALTLSVQLFGIPAGRQNSEFAQRQYQTPAGFLPHLPSPSKASR
jgi:hypothetical protein